MSKTEGHDQLVDLMTKYLKRSQQDFFQECMAVVGQVERRTEDAGFGDKDRAEQRRESMPFVGDDALATFSVGSIALDTTTNKTTTAPDVTITTSQMVTHVMGSCGPPIAWVLLWDGKYCNLYGAYMPDEFRRWGYVMWDERRWNSIEGAKAALTKLWVSSSQLKMAKEYWDWLSDLLEDS